MNHLALLRGINVGGHNLIRMADLKACCEAIGFEEVRTHIQSGNVLFRCRKRSPSALAILLEEAIKAQFGFAPAVVVFAAEDFQAVVHSAPKWWGRDPTWRHNLLALLRDTEPAEVLAMFTAAMPENERAQAGPGVIYHSISVEEYARTKGGVIGKHPAAKRVTVRNHNTTIKLATLLRGCA